MKSRKPILIGCIVLPLVLIVAFIIGFASSFARFGSKVKVPSEAWLVLDSSGIVSDYNEIQSSGLFGSLSPSVADMVQSLQEAAKDRRIKGLFIKPGTLEINYANLRELGLAIKAFKASGKPVIGYGDMMLQKDYLLAAMADSLWMEPSASAGILLEGVSSNILFYKDTLQKLGVKMHVMQSGEFKGAGEIYTNRELSPGTRENIDSVLKTRYDLILEDLAKWRHIDNNRMREVFEERDDIFISAASAKQYGLIDRAASLQELKQKYDITKENTISIGDYPASGPAQKKQKIALIHLSGEIMPSTGQFSDNSISAAKVAKIVTAIKKDKSIKAVVLRVNSPGGSALESELIYKDLKGLSQSIPVVVSMGSTAASGGYYISCAGSYVYADPYTVTGSIGVIMAIPEAKELGSKLGLSSQTLRHGKFASPISLFESYDPAVLQSLQRSSQNTYQEFKQRVTDARKIAPSDIKAIAEGRVWSASDALERKLIDAIGGIDEAIAKAASMAKVTDYSVTTYPIQMSLFEALKESGMFKGLSAKLMQKEPDPAQKIEDMILSTFSPYQWLYRLPWKLE